MPLNRNRTTYAGFILLTIMVGLISRSSIVPEMIHSYLGDALYALMFFFIIGFLFPKHPTLQIAISSIALCFAIELSQLCQADWFNMVRSYRLGGLIFGHTFLWSDLICYAFGGIFGYSLESKGILG